MQELEFVEAHVTLIKSLPVDAASCRAKLSIWKKKAKKFGLVVDKKYLIQDKVVISRSDLFTVHSIQPTAILHILICGYPSGGRGANIDSILKHIDKLCSALQKLKNVKNPTLQDLVKFEKSCRAVKGLGPSTWTKLLYFYQIKIDGYECNILDRVVRQALTNNGIALDDSEFAQTKPKIVREYMSYLKFLQIQAHGIGARTDQVELFLFMFGQNFKLNHEH